MSTTISGSRRILVVDDDEDLRTALVEQLDLHEEFETVTADTAQGGIEARQGRPYRPWSSWMSACRTWTAARRCGLLRKSGFKSPIIMLTGHDADSDTILGLEAGANDYVIKPFRFAVLLARIRAQLRQHDASEDAVFAVGPYSFRPSQKLLINAKGSKIRLTEKETAILRYLYRADQKPVARDVLLSRGVGLQFRRHHPHARDPHLPPAPEDREGSGQRAAAGDRGRRVQAGIPMTVRLADGSR